MANTKNEKINNNLRPLYVKEIIFEHTDEEHFLTVYDIEKILEEDYGIAASRKTIYIDINTLIEAGYDIECIKGHVNKYHVLSREFDNAELRLLIDSVASMQSLSCNQAKTIIKKLSRLAGPSSDCLLHGVEVDARPRSDNNQINYIIDVLIESIKINKQISFKYYEYQTSTKKVLKNGGKEYEVSPYQLVCSSDYYYLLGYSDTYEKVTAFRVDRICGIPKILKKSSVPKPDNVSLKKYMRESFHMKSGTETTVSLTFHTSVIDAMVDRFGQDLDISFLQKDYCIAKVNVPVNNVFFAWLFGFEGKVRIAGPSEVQDQYIRMVSKEMARL